MVELIQTNLIRAIRFLRRGHTNDNVCTALFYDVLLRSRRINSIKHGHLYFAGKTSHFCKSGLQHIQFKLGKNTFVVWNGSISDNIQASELMMS